MKIKTGYDITVRVENLSKLISLAAGVVTLIAITALVFALFREVLWAAVNGIMYVWDVALVPLGFTSLTTVEAIVFVWLIQAVLFYAIKANKHKQLIEIKKENES